MNIHKTTAFLISKQGKRAFYCTNYVFLHLNTCWANLITLPGIFVQASAIKFTGIAERSRKSQRRGTTERSDDNRGRSPRWGQLTWFCLEGSTPVVMYKVPNNCKLFQLVYVVVKTMPSDHNVRNRAFYSDDNRDNKRQLLVVPGCFESLSCTKIPGTSLKSSDVNTNIP